MDVNDAAFTFGPPMEPAWREPRCVSNAKFFLRTKIKPAPCPLWTRGGHRVDLFDGEDIVIHGLTARQHRYLNIASQLGLHRSTQLLGFLVGDVLAVEDSDKTGV